MYVVGGCEKEERERFSVQSNIASRARLPPEHRSHFGFWLMQLFVSQRVVVT